MFSSFFPNRARAGRLLALFLVLASDLAAVSKSDLETQDHLSLTTITAKCHHSPQSELSDPPNVVDWSLQTRLTLTAGSQDFLVLGLQQWGKDKWPAGGMVLIYERQAQIWSLSQDFYCGDTAFGRVRALDMTGDGEPELVAEGSSGNHGQMLAVYQLKQDTFEQILYIDGYGCGPEVSVLGKEPVIIDHQATLLGVCEACRACQGRVQRWKKDGFVADKDEYLDGLAAVREADRADYKDHAQRMLAFLRPFADRHPKHFDAQQNVAELLMDLGSREEAGKYVERMKAVDLQRGKFECSCCDEQGNGNREKAREKAVLK